MNQKTETPCAPASGLREKGGTTALVVAPALPVPFVVISEKLVNSVVDLGVRSIELGQITVDNIAEADLLLADCHVMLKDIEKQRAQAKAPVLKLGKQIDQAVQELTEDLAKIKRYLLECIAPIKAELQRVKDEEERKARLALEELQKRDAPPAEIQQAQAQVESVAIVHDVPKVSVRMVTKHKVIISQPELIPFQLGGLILMAPIEKNILALLKAGLKIPGCSMHTWEEPQMGTVS